MQTPDAHETAPERTGALVQSGMQPVARRWVRIALTLLGATLAWDAVEAGLALWAGHRAGSVSLVTFGLDSIIEMVAAAALIWRLSRAWAGANAEAIERSERRVGRLVGATFVALAIYVMADAGSALWMRDHALPSEWGVALATAALVVMPVLAWAKLHAARRLGSAALAAEAKESIACAYLSAVLLMGLVVNAILGWWWMDAVAALAMVPWLLKEGREALVGEDDD